MMKLIKNELDKEETGGGRLGEKGRERGGRF
jgi:hypothetical protein